MILWLVGSGMLCLSSLSLLAHPVSAGPKPPPPPAAQDLSALNDLTVASSALRGRSLPARYPPDDTPSTPKADIFHSRRNNIPRADTHDPHPQPSTTNTTTDSPASNMERYHINPELDIIVSPGYPIGPANSTALRALLTRATTDAQVSAVRFGPDTRLPGGLKEITEAGLRYEVVAPWHHQRERFTWAQYVALTNWIYRFELGSGGGAERGRNIVCAFLLFKMDGPSGQMQIARGEVRMANGVGVGVRDGSGAGGGDGRPGEGNASVMEMS